MYSGELNFVVACNMGSLLTTVQKEAFALRCSFQLPAKQRKLIKEHICGGNMNICRILIVDDDATMRIALKSLIAWKQHGYELIGEAADGRCV